MNIKRIFVGSAVVLASVCMLSACQTVKGSLTGAEKDVNSVEKAAEKPFKSKPVHHKKMSSHARADHQS